MVFNETQVLFLKKILKENYDNEKYYEEILSTKVDLHFIKTFEESLNFEFFFRYSILNPETIKYIYKNKLYESNEGGFLRFNKLDIEDLTDYIKNGNNIDWEILLENQDFTSKLLTENIKNLNWEITSEYQYMDYKFLTENIKNIKWHLVPLNHKITNSINEAFVIMFKETDIWDNIGYCDNISLEFLLKNKDKLTEKSWSSILEYKKISKENLINCSDLNSLVIDYSSDSDLEI